MLNKLFGGGKAQDQGNNGAKPAPNQPISPIKPKPPTQPQGANLKPTSGPAVAPIKPAQKPEATSPAQSPVDTHVGSSASSLDFQSILDEAAIVFASGEEKAAIEMLVQYLGKTHGKADQRVWYMLLDLYQAVGERQQFEQLSMMFAKIFDTSPPSWDEEVKKQSKEEVTLQETGKNILMLEGGINAALSLKVKEFVSQSREAKTCKVDISRVKPDSCDVAGLEALLQIMTQLRKHKVLATLLGEGRLSLFLDQKVEASKTAPDLKDSIYWLLLLEILQWRGLMDKFEDMSLEYTITFEVSGPGWEEGGVMNVEDVQHDLMIEESSNEEEHEGSINPDETLTEASMQRLQEQIGQSLSEKGEAVIDCRKVKRLDFQSAGSLLSYIASIENSNRKIRVLNPSEPVLALLDVVGVSQYLTIIKRKR